MKKWSLFENREEALDIVSKFSYKQKLFIHRSDRYFKVFNDQLDADYDRAHSLTNRGIYFHEGRTMARYGKNEYEVYLLFKNPFIINTRRYQSDVKNPLTGLYIDVEHISQGDINFLQSEGYDAVMAKYPSFQTVIFDATKAVISTINSRDVLFDSLKLVYNKCLERGINNEFVKEVKKII